MGGADGEGKLRREERAFGGEQGVVVGGDDLSAGEQIDAVTRKAGEGEGVVGRRVGGHVADIDGERVARVGLQRGGERLDEAGFDAGELGLVVGVVH